ncbi:hypothetical protein JCM8202_003730 [Rhodotorula sphaerocarpa]
MATIASQHAPTQQLHPYAAAAGTAPQNEHYTPSSNGGSSNGSSTTRTRASSSAASHGQTQSQQLGMREVSDALPQMQQAGQAAAGGHAGGNKAEAAAPAAAPPAAGSDKPKEGRRIRFSVGTKYQVQEVIGEGAYGVVCSAIHRPSGQRVAIKKIAPFDHSMFALRTLRELKFLRFFAENQVSENLITVVDLIKPPSYDAFQEVYLIQELMETDLHRVIRTQTLSDDHVQYFVYQTLRALKALHSANVIHRDLKPSNLLLNANCDLKICDFGLARSVATAEPAAGSETGFMTEYVATRWYRAPEIMLTDVAVSVLFRQYTKAVDVWSVGCICAEMLNGRPLFPGRDYHHQLTLILSVTGTPTADEFFRITSRRSRDYLRALPLQQPRSFAAMYPDASPEAVDFLRCTLAFDPLKRMTVEEALEHPYLANYHDPTDEPVAPPLEPGFFDFDLQKPDREGLRKLLFEEVMAFRPLV